MEEKIRIKTLVQDSNGNKFWMFIKSETELPKDLDGVKWYAVKGFTVDKKEIEVIVKKLEFKKEVIYVN